MITILSTTNDLLFLHRNGKLKRMHSPDIYALSETMSVIQEIPFANPSYNEKGWIAVCLNSLFFTCIFFISVSLLIFPQCTFVSIVLSSRNGSLFRRGTIL